LLTQPSPVWSIQSKANTQQIRATFCSPIDSSRTGTVRTVPAMVTLRASSLDLQNPQNILNKQI
jgi:hypothetical protein